MKNDEVKQQLKRLSNARGALLREYISRELDIARLKRQIKDIDIKIDICKSQIKWYKENT